MPLRPEPARVIPVLLPEERKGVSLVYFPPAPPHSREDYWLLGASEHSQVALLSRSAAAALPVL